MWLLVLLNVAGKSAAIWIGFTDPAVALALWFVPELVLAYHIFMPHAQGLAPMMRRFPTPRNEVWLTIDDGPDPVDTPQILQLLAAHGARATFFVIGQKAGSHPELVHAILAGGHEVAHHTQTHPLASFWCASPRRTRRELDDALAVLRTLGVRPARFRPPATFKNLWLGPALATRGLSGIGWTRRGLERRSVEPEEVADRVLHRLAPGNILLLHEGAGVPPAIRVHAIRRVLERLHARGYACVVPAPAAVIGAAAPGARSGARYAGASIDTGSRAVSP